MAVELRAPLTLPRFQPPSVRNSTSRLRQPFSCSRSSPTLHLFLAPVSTSRRGVIVFRCRACASDFSSDAGGSSRAAPKWASLVPGLGGGRTVERILRLVAGATSAPFCQFVSTPRTFLHDIDPRVKLVWLLALVLLPARSNIFMQCNLVLCLSVLSIWSLPSNVWMDQLGRVGILSAIVFVMLGFGSDGAPLLVQTRTPPPLTAGLPNVPSSLAGYSYTLMKFGPLQFTRKGLSVASASSCLSFMIFQSANLCLTTATPEQLASALRWFLTPLKHIGIPVAEITLTLLLSLRFINVVFDEIRNIALGIVARRIQWHRLSYMESLDLFFLYIRRIFKNIFSHSEQISKAMIARGFRGDAETHKIYFLTRSSLGAADYLSLLFLLAIVAATSLSEKVW